jgi:hypothetical protein
LAASEVHRILDFQIARGHRSPVAMANNLAHATPAQRQPASSEAKTKFFDLVKRARAGKGFLITLMEPKPRG